MTYKEKVKAEAFRIIEKYEKMPYLKDWEGMYYPLAKECALLEIDGRIEEVEHWQPRVIFLQEVKQEIFNI
jgi:hypothetical protein